MTELLLDNSLIFIGLTTISYISYKIIFHIHKHNIEPHEIAHAYFLVKRRRNLK